MRGTRIEAPKGLYAHQKNTPYGGIFSLDEARRAVRASKKYPLWGYFYEKNTPYGGKLAPKGLVEVIFLRKNTPYWAERDHLMSPLGSLGEGR